MPTAPVATPARHGTRGRVLVVDLSAGISHVEAVEESVYRQFLAGYGLGVPLRDLVERSPHLRHTLMLNGERCPLAENLDRGLADGDELYLLGPIAGG